MDKQFGEMGKQNFWHFVVIDAFSTGETENWIHNPTFLMVSAPL